MGIWTNNDQRTVLDDGEDFGNPPGGGRLKQWLAGLVTSLAVIVFGARCLAAGSTPLFGKQGSIELQGTSGEALAVAYIALGAFIHFHYFWGLMPDKCALSQGGKTISLVVFLACFLFVVWQVLDPRGWQ